VGIDAEEEPRRAAPPVQKQARALGDPTRYAIFQQIASATEPLRVAALAKYFGLNHTAVRQHLAKLCDAGVLLEEWAPRAGPGRPALQYRVATQVAGRWGTESPYEQLAILLLELARGDSSARAVGAKAGRQAAVARGREGSPVALLVDEMQRRGFEPRRVEKGARVEIVLEHCPFATAAVADPTIVCEIHRGLAEGFLAEVDGDVDGDVEVSDLVVRNALRAGCRLLLRARRN
jgi:predicted ArsR family transcriptional regulator